MKKLYKAGLLFSAAMVLCCLPVRTAQAADSGILKFEQGNTKKEIKIAVNPTEEMLLNKATTMQVRLNITGSGLESVQDIKMVFADNKDANIKEYAYDKTVGKADIFLSGADAVFKEGENVLGTLSVEAGEKSVSLTVKPEFIEVADQTSRMTAYRSDELGEIQYTAKINTSEGGDSSGGGGNKTPGGDGGKQDDGKNKKPDKKLAGSGSTVKTSSKTRSGKTGDDAKTGLYILLSALSACAVVIVVKKRIR